jgi:HAD superfamily hydrolase (TIGR01544 family)
MKKIILSDDFEDIKSRIISEGPDKFHVLADFDRTLTKATVGDQKIPSIISFLRSGKYLTKDYAPRAYKLFDEYHPVEINPDIPLDEKKEKMEEWWKKHFDLLVECGLDRETIKKCATDMVKANTLVLREGVEKFFEFLSLNNIPLVIMSASIGDLIIEFLKQKGILYPNIHIISNVFEFDKIGNVVGVKNLVHVFSKEEMEVKIPEVMERKNVLLLGDSIGDLDMIKGFDYDNLLTVGFLNEGVKGNLEVYEEMFEAVLLGDPNFDFVNDLIKEWKA